VSTSERTGLVWLVNNCKQFAADVFRRGPQRSIKHLRIYIQRRVYTDVAHEFRDDHNGCPELDGGVEEMTLTAVESYLPISAVA